VQVHSLVPPLPWAVKLPKRQQKAVGPNGQYDAESVEPTRFRLPTASTTTGPQHCPESTDVTGFRQSALSADIAHCPTTFGAVFVSSFDVHCFPRPTADETPHIRRIAVCAALIDAAAAAVVAICPASRHRPHIQSVCIGPASPSSLDGWLVAPIPSPSECSHRSVWKPPGTLRQRHGVRCAPEPHMTISEQKAPLVSSLALARCSHPIHPCPPAHFVCPPAGAIGCHRTSSDIIRRPPVPF